MFAFYQLMTVADCASRLRRLSQALDVNDLRLEDTTDPTSQELVRLHFVGLGLDIKESLLEACGLVLLAKTHLDPHSSGELLLKYFDLLFHLLNIVNGQCLSKSDIIVIFALGVLDRLVSSVEQQQREMTSIGLLDVYSRPEDQELGGSFRLSRQELQQLRHRVQLWPLMEKLAVLNQLRLSHDLLHLAFSPGYHFLLMQQYCRPAFQVLTVIKLYLLSILGLIDSDQKAEESLRRELSRHLRYCLQSTPINLSHLQPLWFLLSSDKVREIKILFI